MKEIVKKHGWPTKKMVGFDGTRAAWLLVQHADQEVHFQHKCLILMEAHKDDGQVTKSDLAYLTDRVSVNESKPQVYGTQGHIVEGVWQPRAMIDKENVEKRRSAMGLMTLKKYIEFMHT